MNVSIGTGATTGVSLGRGNHGCLPQGVSLGETPFVTEVQLLVPGHACDGAAGGATDYPHPA